MSDSCPLSASAAEGELVVSLELGGPVVDEAAVLLVMFPADFPHANVTAAVHEAEFDWSREWEGAAVEDSVELVFPSEAEPVSLQWVRWDADVARARAITFREEEEDAYGGKEFVVRVADTVGAVAGPEHRSAFVSGATPLPIAVPEFSTVGQQLLHRKGDLQFELVRTGSVSPLQSVVQWRIVYLDPPVDSAQDASGAVPTSLNASFEHPPSNISAVLNSTGTVTWPAQSMETSKQVIVPIDWGAVPYVARWMMVVQLSILFNGQLASDVFSLLSLPPTTTQSSNISSLHDQLTVLSSAVAGSACVHAATTNAILYGVEEGSCPPGTGRTLGTAKGVPVPELLASPGIHSLALQMLDVDQGAGEGADGDAAFWMPSLPQFNASTHAYALTIPFGYSNVSIVIATSAVGYYVLDGCGNDNGEPVTAPISRQTLASPVEIDEKGNEGGKLRQLLWPVVQPETSRCTAEVHVCSSATGIDNCGSHTADSSYHATVAWLQDPMLAVISAVNVTAGGLEAVRVCSSGGEHALKDHACPQDARVRPGANATHELCAVSECVPHTMVSTGLTYKRGEQIQVAVEPMYAESVRSVSIGQRVFRAQSSSTLGHVAVSFTLFDSSDRLSPFVPFFIRWRSKDRTLLDVPITLTLKDGRTSAPLKLMLDIDVQPAPPPPPTPPNQNLTVPEAGAAQEPGSEPPPPEVPTGTPLQIVTEGASFAVVQNSSSPEIPRQPGAMVVPADAVSDTDAVPADSRKLLDVSSSAPHDQAWAEDPLQNAECSVCVEGTFSDRCCSCPLHA